VSPEVEALIEKGRRSLRSARRVDEDGDHDFAVSRAYYAMFYLAEALLLDRHRAASKHTGVISEFNRLFVRTGEFPSRHLDALRKAFEERIDADYEFQAEFSRERTRAVLDSAQDFLDHAEAYLRRRA
jgi:uncharacterized protein (UPF0332 family)